VTDAHRRSCQDRTRHRRSGSVSDEGRAEEGRNLEDLSDEELDRIVRKSTSMHGFHPSTSSNWSSGSRPRDTSWLSPGTASTTPRRFRPLTWALPWARPVPTWPGKLRTWCWRTTTSPASPMPSEEGRVVFANIRKVTYFLLSTGIGLVITILSALFGPWPLPYVAAQVLWINLVTKGLQDVSLAFEPGEPGLLQEPPRDPQEGVINRAGVLFRMIGLGAFMAAGTLAMFWWIFQQGVSLELARSAAMTTMVMFQFFHVFNCRSFTNRSSGFDSSANPYLLGSVALALLAHLAILHLPWMQKVFRTEPLSLELWGIITASVSVSLDLWSRAEREDSTRV
jgi:hypothetical protein